MRVIDADGHVEENPITFSDKYFAIKPGAVLSLTGFLAGGPPMREIP